MDNVLRICGFGFVPHVVKGKASKLDLFPDYLAFSIQIVMLTLLSYCFDSMYPLLGAMGLLFVGNMVYLLKVNI
jgi:hypothetical protein